ncbi:TIGR01777 family oxidoreductase [Alkalihalobacterium elongatum]|uniref:TIGR01777 family oxidoreductase n=1 Tax=Alkalihalobacterium elongatum TaxID=2675466 RepID=UPI001C1F586E|nr:TIGR01777 family oxidoreductase [Alkalihalobacterium elongatum]
MNIAIAGGTGFIGTELTQHFTKQGHQIYILTRTPKEKKENINFIQWLVPDSKPHEKLPKIDVFINLAGESIGAGRWTQQRKERILKSRITATKAAVSLMEQLEHKPSVFINASAIGVYGHSNTITFTEKNTDGGKQNFLKDVVVQWEKEAEKAKNISIRTVLPRLGLVLDKNEGALPKMLLPYELFAGGALGSGEQWYSWIHIQDVVGMIEFAINNDQIEGALNVTSPNPVQMKEMGKAIASALKRPHWLPTPSFALKLILGEMSALLLEGQRVIPDKAIHHGFTFSFPSIDGALKHLLAND